MSQSRKHSMLEVGSNTALGFVGSWLITVWCMKTLSPPETAATASVTLCTVWSLVRGYFVRRHFNGRQA